MTSRIFRSIFFAVVIALVAALLISTGVFYSYFCDVQESQLKDELALAATATEQMGEVYLEELESSRYRLTWVDPEGTVLYDSHADAAMMENHGEREEIKEALATGTGSGSRQSSTLTEQTVYEATRLADGSVLRISVSRATAFVLALGMIQPMVAVLLIASALSAWLAHGMAKKVVEPLNKLDLEKPLENKIYEELSPLLYRIHTQHQEIRNQVRTLKHKQAEFDQITGNMKEGLVLLDNAGRILSMNPAARILFDVDRECTGENFLTVNRKQSVCTAIEKAETEGAAEFREQINGREYQFDLSRIDSGGKPRGVAILAFDITEQVHAESHRREFTANVSHELKTPLQSIIGSAELMENGIVKEEDIPRFVGRIRTEASRLVTLIEDIIGLSELDEGAEMPREKVSLKSISLEVAETLANAAKEKAITVEVTGDEGEMTGVYRLLYEIIYNLCDNAIKYNVQGGFVNVSVESNLDEICLRVQDNGLGIAPEHHDKVFERFYRVDKSHSKQSGGTGLGLSIVKHAVQYHHGKLQIESELDRGTTIYVTFPKGKKDNRE